MMALPGSSRQYFGNIFKCQYFKKKYNIKGIGCPLLISINIDVSFLTKKRKMIRLEPRLMVAR